MTNFDGYVADKLKNPEFRAEYDGDLYVYIQSRHTYKFT